MDNEIYLYDDATGVTRQISESSLDNCFATIYGSNVVWAGKANDGSDFEIFRYDISTGVVTRLTNNDFDDKNPQLSERFVTWWASPPGGMNSIYVYDLQNPARGPVKISDDAFNNADPRVSESHVVWSGTQGGVSHVFFWDGTFRPDGTPTPPVQLTSGSSFNTRPQIDGNNVVWQSVNLSGGTNQIFWWDGTFQFGGRPSAAADQRRRRRQHRAADFRQQRGLAGGLDGRRDATEPDRVLRPVRQHAARGYLRERPSRESVP